MNKDAAKLGNLVGFLKHIIGMCSDEESHNLIAGELWKAIAMVRTAKPGNVAPIADEMLVVFRSIIFSLVAEVANGFSNDHPCGQALDRLYERIKEIDLSRLAAKPGNVASSEWIDVTGKLPLTPVPIEDGGIAPTPDWHPTDILDRAEKWLVKTTGIAMSAETLSLREFVLEEIRLRYGAPMPTERLLRLVEEAGVILADEEIQCDHKHNGTFAKLSELRTGLKDASEKPIDT